MYKLYKNTITNEIIGAIKQNGQDVVSFMFFDPDNSDYQAYLAWVALGNTPLPAEEQA